MQAMNYVLRRLAKNVPNVTTDTTEQCMKVDLNSNYAGQCDTAIESKDSNSSECETTCKVAYMSCDESECKEAAKEAITKAVIEGDCQIKNENEGCSEDSNLLKKASEIAPGSNWWFNVWFTSCSKQQKIPKKILPLHYHLHIIICMKKHNIRV